ncbi:MAG: lytic transglycosylase domain-containing protein [Candidatus Aureabacteria bacterium]|nr:lytic transglycosylase domain-containing protein [Candidatus Auribacterota bacterium]
MQKRYQHISSAARLRLEMISMIMLALYVPPQAHAGLAINMKVIQSIESNGDPFAFNPQTKCYGLYQISEYCLVEFNRAHGTRYMPNDLFNPRINEMIAVWYFARLQQLPDSYNIPISITTIIALYNWGIGNVVRWHRNGASFEDLPEPTQLYIERYYRLAAVMISE